MMPTLLVFCLGVVVSALINIITALFSRERALHLMPWLLLYLMLHGTFALFTYEPLYQTAMDSTRKANPLTSYVIVALIGAALADVYWFIASAAAAKVAKATSGTEVGTVGVITRPAPKIQAVKFYRDKGVFRDKKTGRLRRRRLSKGERTVNIRASSEWAWFLHLDFFNDSAAATSAVYARIFIKDRATDTWLFNCHGLAPRWGSTPENARQEFAVFGPKMRPGHELDIAFKYPHDDAAYLWTNFSYSDDDFPDGKVDGYRIPPGSYTAHVELEGDGVRGAWDMEFTVDAGGELRKGAGPYLARYFISSECLKSEILIEGCTE